MILKRALKGELDLVGPAWAVQKELTGLPSMDIPTGPLVLKKEPYKNLKKFF